MTSEWSQVHLYGRLLGARHCAQPREETQPLLLAPFPQGNVPESRNLAPNENDRGGVLRALWSSPVGQSALRRAGKSCRTELFSLWECNIHRVSDTLPGSSRLQRAGTSWRTERQDFGKKEDFGRGQLGTLCLPGGYPAGAFVVFTFESRRPGLLPGCAPAAGSTGSLPGSLPAALPQASPCSSGSSPTAFLTGEQIHLFVEFGGADSQAAARRREFCISSLSIITFRATACPQVRPLTVERVLSAPEL